VFRVTLDVCANTNLKKSESAVVVIMPESDKALLIMFRLVAVAMVLPWSSGL
jgi:hypothetical protein